MSENLAIKEHHYQLKKDQLYFYNKPKIAIAFTFFILIARIIITPKFTIDNNSIPKVSIFIPIYNKQKYLKRSINSIQKQTLKDIEIIAVNDCSTDNSLDILREIAKKDSRIKIIIKKKITDYYILEEMEY